MNLPTRYTEGGVVEVDSFLREKVFHIRLADLHSASQVSFIAELLDFDMFRQQSYDVYSLQEILNKCIQQTDKNSNSPRFGDVEADASLVLHDKIYVIPQASKSYELKSSKDKKNVLLVQVKIISYEYKGQPSNLLILRDITSEFKHEGNIGLHNMYDRIATSITNNFKVPLNILSESFSLLQQNV